MKILVVSLHRLGDFFLHQTLESSIRAKYGQVEIEYLINDSVQGYLITRGIKHHVFPREALQRFLVEPYFNPVSAHFLLHQTIEQINHQGYHAILNLTQSRAAAALMRLLRSAQIFGPRLGSHDWSPEESDWIRLVDRMAQNPAGPSPLQWLDASARAAGLKMPNLQPQVFTNSRQRRHLGIQLNASSKEKSFRPSELIGCLAKVRLAHPNLRVSLLGCPMDQPDLESLADTLRSMSLAVSVDVRSFSEWENANEENRWDLILTPDTSAMHFAARLGVPLVALFRGSANPFLTAPRMEGAVLLQRRADTAQAMSQSECADLGDAVIEVLQHEARSKSFFHSWITRASSAGGLELESLDQQPNERGMQNEPSQEVASVPGA